MGWPISIREISLCYWNVYALRLRFVRFVPFVFCTLMMSQARHGLFFRRLLLFSARHQIRSRTSQIHRVSDSPEHNLGQPGHSQICEQVKRDLTIKYDCIGQGQSIHIITHASNERLGKPLLRQQAVVIYQFSPPTPICLASAVCLLSLSFISYVVLLLFVLFHCLN